MNIIYSVLHLDKISLGPKTRISMFIKVFQRQGDYVIEGKNKLLKTLKAPRAEMVYVETAPNRIGLIDVVNLLLLKKKSKKLVVFIRDVYIEMFPEEYTGFRKKITYFANRLSYRFLSWVGSELVFPTVQMGDFFYLKNKSFVQKPYKALPPGTSSDEFVTVLPDFSKTLGFLYLGSVSYKNSGFENFIRFARQYQDRFNFFVLSKDPQIKTYQQNDYIKFDSVSHSEILNYIQKNNIAFGFHSRPRNAYDDITFPIKILDFINFRLPFVSAPHLPLLSLVGSDYPLFVDITQPRAIHESLKSLLLKESYQKLVTKLDEVAQNNTYEVRYKQIIQA